MKKLTDEELDLVFKAAVEGNTLPYDATAWDAMAQKLDEPRPIPVWRRWMPLLLIGTSLFLTGVWVGRNSTDSSGKLATLERKAAESEGSLEIKEELSARDMSMNPQSKVETVSESSNRVEDVKSGIRLNSDYVSTNQNFNTHDHVPGDLLTLSEIEPEKRPQSEAQVAAVNQSELTDTLSIKKLALDTVTLAEVETDSVDIRKEQQNKPGGKKVYGLFIRFLASPDLSSIKFGPAQLGSNFGVMGEFAFSDRFSVSTGVLRSKKNYESFQKEAYGANAGHLTGSCSILDIPINVTYYFQSKNRFSVYASAGASSYLMLREDYVYIIKSGYGDKVYPSQAIRENNEWFKVLNLAVGMQYKIAPRWQAQIEPFIKAPLADLGERNVRLSSLGVFGGLRYQLNSTIKNP
jgi:hypothetical protein